VNVISRTRRGTTAPDRSRAQLAGTRIESPATHGYARPMTSIVVADDHGIVREGLRRLLESEPAWTVCGEAADGREVLEEVARSKPDVVVLDITMPRLGGLETLERLRAEHPETKVVLLSVHSDPPFIQSAIALGVDGYVLKNGPSGEIVTAIQAVTRDGNYFSPAVAREIVEQLRTPRPEGDDPFSLLSVREREVLHRIADGLTAKEVAVELSISTKTVEAHRTSLMRKLGVRKATELVRYALRHGLIEP
jgi:DNA-binding NarL/FixJ family response regulator